MDAPLAAQLTRAIVAALPPEIRAQLAPVPIRIVPDAAALSRACPGDPVPVDALGCFDGAPLRRAVPEDDECEEWEPPRGTIWIVAAPHADRGALERTVLHEIGHALGLDEYDVHEVGL